ncbi:CYTH and CHAD domain-containing protein [Streptomyces graminilatus]|uniref:CYTH and CHAD domain-containing protein n=1 Tax=Streptomyces graminilatus TaxID=1464070 RepID=UPI0006E41972|nr:CYTH and CHAD domain-containing protein [Streptomyces graminilatus]
MADTKREIERKYESDDSGLPDLTGAGTVADVVDKGTVELDATYYDTSDLRLASASITLRRRTGGSDAGWHLKLPVGPGIRDEIQAPLSDTVPDELVGLVRARVREGQLVPVVRLRSTRDLRDLVDSAGRQLAEVGVDTVRADRLFGGKGTAEWTEIEVELADGGDQRILDKVEKRLRKAGVRPSKSTSKLARALAETKGGQPRPKDEPAEPVTAGDHVLAYVRAQRDAVVDLDPAVRQDAEESVHDMRVATRRLRSTFKSFRAVLDRKITDPIADELKWLAGELGVGRDQEVLAEQLATVLDELPPALVHGPIRDRLGNWSKAEHKGARRRLLGVLDSPRYLALLDALDAVVTDPPVLRAAAKKPEKVLAKAVREDFAKVAALIEEGMEQPPGTDRDLGLHDARKKAKRTRYAAEAATPALGDPAKALAKSMKSLQTLLGDHQDSHMLRVTLGELAAVAHAAGEDTFTYGLLYGRQEQRAARLEERVPEEWEAIQGSLEI